MRICQVAFMLVCMHACRSAWGPICLPACLAACLESSTISIVHIHRGLHKQLANILLPTLTTMLLSLSLGWAISPFLADGPTAMLFLPCYTSNIEPVRLLLLVTCRFIRRKWYGRQALADKFCPIRKYGRLSGLGCG